MNEVDCVVRFDKKQVRSILMEYATRTVDEAVMRILDDGGGVRARQAMLEMPMQLSLVAEPAKPIFAARSGHWSTVRNQHLEKQPTCAVCGGDKDLQVHHIKPYHLHPELELEPTNLITLCEPSKIIHVNCHLLFGHLGNWHAFNTRMIEMAAEFLQQLKHRTIN